MMKKIYTTACGTELLDALSPRGTSDEGVLCKTL